MTPGIDTGAIAYQSRFSVAPRPTALSLSAQCARLGLSLLVQLLRDATADPASIPRVPQDPTQREYFGRRILQDGLLHWDRPVEEVDRLIRAFQFHPFPSPWGSPRTQLDAKPLGILLAEPSATHRPLQPPGTIGPTEHGGTLVACNDGWLAVHLVSNAAGICSANDALTTGHRLATPTPVPV
jgi:methionyl-tRNA formyltransferase